MNKEDIARVAHEVNRAYCEALGDLSQPAWEAAPAWQRESTLHVVEMHLADPAAGPEASHQAWMAEKLAAGWRYGPVKNPATKEHPSLVPYEALPLEERVKDYLFRGVVRALASVP